ncbi:MAG TPA: globin [Arcobacter sp.]|nr:globin [Arcobacter sp.]
MVNYTITTAIMGERPKVTNPNKGFLETLTEKGFTDMIEHFYSEVLDSQIAHFFPDDEAELEIIKTRNGSYFMMMCGGDERYLTKYDGIFDQIKTHEMFSIPDKARTEWLGCWETVLKPLEGKVSDEDIQSYWNWLEVFSKHIVNYENDRSTYEDNAKTK